MMRMDENEDWDKNYHGFVTLSQGKTTLKILGNPMIENNTFGRQQFVFPTNLGRWGVAIDGSVASALVKYKRQTGSIIGAQITIERIGEGLHTKYNVINIDKQEKL